MCVYVHMQADYISFQANIITVCCIEIVVCVREKKRRRHFTCNCNKDFKLCTMWCECDVIISFVRESHIFKNFYVKSHISVDMSLLDTKNHFTSPTIVKFLYAWTWKIVYDNPDNPKFFFSYYKLNTRQKKH